MRIKSASRHLMWTINDLLPKEFVPKKGRGELRVLCFHGICEDQDELINGRFLKKTHFTNLLSALDKNFNIISLEQFLNKELDPNKMNLLLTFDDGYANIRKFVLPLIETRGISITVFLNGHDSSIFDLIDIGSNSPQHKGQITTILSSFGINKPTRRDSLLHLSIEQTVKLKEKLIETLHNILKEKETFFKLLIRDELIEMNESDYVYLANHSYHHMDFTKLNSTVMESEYTQMKPFLESLHSNYYDVFAYPFGHFNSETIQHLNDLGARAQFITEGSKYPVEGAHDRLVINPFISIYNQLKAIENGYY